MKTPEELAEHYVQVWWGPREDNMSLATRQAFIAGYQAAAPQWISVKDRLPEHNTYVLVTDGSEVHRSKVWEEFFLVSVTHWMPLPKPPEVK